MRFPKCPKCSDQGYVLKEERAGGKIVGYRKIRCLKNCEASRTWTE